mmetsp:Transcript_107700/g.300090  ORF Transcript_107700/g.300090 Transcript_107700/m.300090 type:complete len:295 (-) Transcript_107700:1772-2656(-)
MLPGIPAADEAIVPLVGARRLPTSMPSIFLSHRCPPDWSLPTGWSRCNTCLRGSLWQSATLVSNQGGRSDRTAGSSVCGMPRSSSRPPLSRPLPPAARRPLGPRGRCQPSASGVSPGASDLRAGSRLRNDGGSSPLPSRGATQATVGAASSRLTPSSRRPASRHEPAGARGRAPRGPALPLSPPPSSRAQGSSHGCSSGARSSRAPSLCGAPPRRSFHGGTRSPRSVRSSSCSDLASPPFGARRLPESRCLPPPSDLIWSLSFCNGTGICCFAPSKAATNAVVCLTSKCGEKKV